MRRRRAPRFAATGGVVVAGLTAAAIGVRRATRVVRFVIAAEANVGGGSDGDAPNPNKKSEKKTEKENKKQKKKGGSSREGGKKAKKGK